MQVMLGCSQHKERQDTAQACKGSQQPLDVSVGLMLVLVTSSKNEQKKARRGKKIWGLGGPVEGWQHPLSPRGRAGIQHLAGGRIPRELLPIPIPPLQDQPGWRVASLGQPHDTSPESLGMP